MTMTAMMIGPVGEVFGLEILANSAMLQAVTRAGLVVGGGKVLNLFGMFKPAVTQSVAAQTKEALVAESHPLYGYTVNQVVQKVTELGLETPPNSLLLWSRIGVDGTTISEEFARANGYVTLEMTPGGKWLNEVNLRGVNSPFTLQEVNNIWESVSINLIRRARGQINSIVGNFGPNAIYMSELKEAKSLYPQITGVDQLQLLPRMIFK